MWGWGGFLLTDRRHEEYEALAAETGVAAAEIPTVLKAFDHLFPMGGGWLHDEGERLVLKLMPAAMRGVGALHRLRRHHVDRYPQLGCLDGITRALVSDHNTFVRLLDGGGAELVK